MKKFTKKICHNSVLTALLTAMLLAACGGGGGSPYPERQFGVTEKDLRSDINKEAGIVVGRGSGLVVTQIEPADGPQAPKIGDSARIGDDAMLFDVDNPGIVSVDLTQGNSLSVVNQVAVESTNGELLLVANAATPKASLELPKGRYLLRLTASTDANEVMLGMVWFGGTAKSTNMADLQKLNSGSCVSCNLQGANLSALNLRGNNLMDSDLSQALLVRVSGGFTLRETDIMTIYLGGSAVRGADLGGANLAGAQLSGAYLTGGAGSSANFLGANLTSASVNDVFLAHANFEGANLANANFTRSTLTRANLRAANLSNAVFIDADLRGADLTAAGIVNTNWAGTQLGGAIWTDGRICAAGSVGACNK